MSENLDSMMEWVLGVLRGAAHEGVSISQLFEQFDDAFEANDDFRKQIWNSLLARNDVMLADEKAVVLDKSAIKKLDLAEICQLGLGEKKIRLAQESSSQSVTSKPTSPSEPDVPPGKRKAAVEEDGHNPAKKSRGSLPKPAPKRRGRPPKNRKDSFPSNQLPRLSTPVEAAVPSFTLVPEAQDSTQQTRIVSGLRANNTAITVRAVEKVDHHGTDSTGDHVGEREDTPDSVSLINTDPLPTHPTNTLFTTPSGTGEATLSAVPSIQDSDTQTVANVVLLIPPEAPTSAAHPTVAPRDVTANVPLDARHTSNSPVESSSDLLAQAADGPVTPQRPTASPLQRSSRGRHRIDHWQDFQSRQSKSPLRGKATFTSQNELNWEAGESGVYIDPPGSKKSTELKNRGDSSCIAVFRSSKLKDPERLVKGKDTWQDHIMPAVARAMLAVEDQALAKPKRGRDIPSWTPKKRGRPRKQPEVVNDVDLDTPVAKRRWTSRQSAQVGDDQSPVDTQLRVESASGNQKSIEDNYDFDTEELEFQPAHSLAWDRAPLYTPASRGDTTQASTQKLTQDILSKKQNYSQKKQQIQPAFLPPRPVTVNPTGWSTSWTKSKAEEQITAPRVAENHTDAKRSAFEGHAAEKQLLEQDASRLSKFGALEGQPDEQLAVKQHTTKRQRAQQGDLSRQGSELTAYEQQMADDDVVNELASIGQISENSAVKNSAIERSSVVQESIEQVAMEQLYTSDNQHLESIPDAKPQPAQHFTLNVPSQDKRRDGVTPSRSASQQLTGHPYPNVSPGGSYRNIYASVEPPSPVQSGGYRSIYSSVEPVSPLRFGDVAAQHRPSIISRERTEAEAQSYRSPFESSHTFSTYGANAASTLRRTSLGAPAPINGLQSSAYGSAYASYGTPAQLVSAAGSQRSSVPHHQQATTPREDYVHALPYTTPYGSSPLAAVPSHVHPTLPQQVVSLPEDQPHMRQALHVMPPQITLNSTSSLPPIPQSRQANTVPNVFSDTVLIESESLHPSAKQQGSQETQGKQIASQVEPTPALAQLVLLPHTASQFESQQLQESTSKDSQTPVTLHHTPTASSTEDSITVDAGALQALNTPGGPPQKGRVGTRGRGRGKGRGGTRGRRRGGARGRLHVAGITSTPPPSEPATPRTDDLSPTTPITTGGVDINLVQQPHREVLAESTTNVCGAALDKNEALMESEVVSTIVAATEPHKESAVVPVVETTSEPAMQPNADAPVAAPAIGNAMEEPLKGTEESQVVCTTDADESIPVPEEPFESAEVGTVTQQLNPVAESIKQSTQVAMKKPQTKRQSQVINSTPHSDGPVQPPTQKRVAKTPRPMSKAAALSAHDQKLKEDLDQAAAMNVPDGVTQFPCVFDGNVGNLLLSRDKTTLEFFTRTEPPPHMPIIDLKISRVIGNPITSMKGSTPMELRIKAIGPDGIDITYCFVFAGTQASYNSASNMRAMIVTGTIALQFKGGDYASVQETKFALDKPFQCPKCKERFKNANGLEYHLTKAKTSTCNPNHDPTRDLDMRIHRKRPSVAKPENTAPVNRTPRTPRKATAASRSAKKREQDDDENESVSSEDSIVEWCQNNSTTGFSTTATASKPNRRYMALHREGDIALEILQDIASAAIAAQEEDDLQPLTPIRSVLITAADVAKGMSCVELTDEWYKEVVTALVAGNRNIFPAGRSVWFASVAVWLKQHTVTEVLPESKFCAKAVDDLVYANTLQLVEFSYTGRKSRIITRGILTTPNLSMESQHVELLKTMIENLDPGYYVPSQFAPPQAVLDKLQAVASRSLPSLPVEETLMGEEDEPSPIHDHHHESEDDFIPEDKEEIPDADDFEIDETEVEEEEFDEDGDGDSFVGGVRTSSSKRPRWTKATSSGLRRRDKSHNAKISAGVRRKMEAIRNGAENPYPWAIHPKSRTLTYEEKEARAAERRKRDAEKAAQQAKQIHCWDQAPSFMPNPATGAWDISPPAPQEPLVGKTGRKITSYSRRQRLPEPITYMQAPDGAWSIRPFGHGVNPIYSRPARRADGNPNLQAYLKRIQDGHRPIVYPPTKNQVHFPLPPSKHMLRALQLGAEVSETTGLPIQPPKRPRAKYKRGEKRATLSPSPDDDEEYGSVTPKRRRLNNTTSARATRPRAARTARIVTSPTQDDDDTEVTVRVSRATGRPVRSYNRRFPKQNFAHDAEEALDVPTTRGHPSKRHKGLSEVDILNFYEPKKLTDSAPTNPGLDTVPIGFGFSNSKSNVDGSEHAPKYDIIQFIEPLKVQEDMDPIVGSWTVERIETNKSATFGLRWDDATAFTLNNLPYSQLEEDDSDDELDQMHEPNEEAVKPKGFLKRVATNARGGKVSEAQKYGYTRHLSALPSDFVDLFEDPAKATEHFGVEVGVPNVMTLKRSRNLGSNVMAPEIENRFVVAVTLLRILTGGLDMQVDWVIIGSLFPHYSLNFAAKTWKAILVRKKSAIEQLEADFREAFVAGYRRGDIQPIDYDHLIDYPWDTLIDWTMENIDSALSNKKILLPATKEECSDIFETKPFNDMDGSVAWREQFFSLATAVYKRIDSSASEAHTILVGPKKRRFDHIDEFQVAQSWIRSSALTPDEDWDAAKEQAKLAELDPDIVEEAFKDLVTRKITKKLAKRGRAYRPHETWPSVFTRSHIKEPQFAEAVVFKRDMDARFRRGEPSLNASYFANEGAIMCLTSLQAHGRIKFVAGKGLPNNKFNLGNGSYETKKIPKEVWQWDINIYPTATYVFDDDNAVLRNYEHSGPPRGGASGEIPVWFGVTERVSTEAWRKIFSSVAQVVALRAGIDDEYLRKKFGGKLEEWEWNLLMEWGVGVGVFERVWVGGAEGWTVGEWWWLVVGVGCLGEGVEAGQGIGEVGEGEGEDVFMTGAV